MDQYLTVSSEPSHDVAVLSMEDLKRLVSDAVRQKILSLEAFFVNLRLEKMRKYSSVQVRNTQGIMYVPPPA